MPADAQPRRPNYRVKSIEPVVAGRDVQARIFTLAPGEVIPAHSHSEITDHYFVLSGTLTIATRAPDIRRNLELGERHQISPGTIHTISNHGTSDCRFLLLQGPGRYDWVTALD
jgi:quercetin dioxygenase-like cupin family protein